MGDISNVSRKYHNEMVDKLRVEVVRLKSEVREVTSALRECIKHEFNRAEAAQARVAELEKVLDVAEKVVELHASLSESGDAGLDDITDDLRFVIAAMQKAK
jgi:hypothetical protein